ncbi:hypothetical protein IMG5_001780 [Ichthyophthirius multifiliis]|uniref:UspA domain-containing protein n=1 Tax=Ichthyophthirius multifiliis TaxID=5932 RepID=G0QJ08_ICHMU|nr:hypothetical protein IMG5_001780 [Ichthyophthirius multifiliis]EGR34801.1 hypothetical protein IMG5_001780 [Ichthyophthirius multifiliis]|eukprot:XP_004040105.1 hypothetical protein IMG5_001780 [Ichthyophthirius multifiliis]
MNKKDFAFENIAVATDGSDFSFNAFLQALEFFNKNLFRVIHVIHIYDLKKTFLPEQFNHNHIEQQYKSELLSRYSSTKYNLIFQEKSLQYKDVRDQILSICQAYKIDYLFIGYTGRKGVKQNPQIMSSTVRDCSQLTITPLVITHEVYTKNNGNTFLACVDGSLKSIRCIQEAVKLANGQNDFAIICFVPNPLKQDQKNEIENQVVQELQQQKKNNWEFINLKPNQDPGEAIVDFVNLTCQRDIQFVLIGNNGFGAQNEGKQFLGKSAEAVLCRAKANIIVIS